MKQMACAALACLGALSTVAKAGAPSGPRANPDDQIRSFGLPVLSCYDALVRAGFNQFVPEFKQTGYGFTDSLTDAERKDEAEMLRQRQEWLDRTTRDGLDYAEKIMLQQENVFHSPLWGGDYFILSPEGKVENPKGLDRSNPALRALLSKAVAALVAKFPDPAPPSFTGIKPASEVRGHARPSYTPEFKARWRAASGGQEIPEGCTGRYGPNWKDLPGFPASRIVPDDHPILAFYRWFYRDGDGWNDYLNEIADAAEKKIGRPIMTSYDPVVRQPATRGYAAGMNYWGQWHYPYPEPYNVSYIISEIQAMNRTDPDRQTEMSIQGISYRRALAPKGVTVTNPPAWLKTCPNVVYMTTPPAVACEAFWTVFTRRLSGLSFYAIRSLFDFSDPRYPDGRGGYQFTNGETFPAVADLFNRVAVPLGPLFKAIPERPMEVAVLESFASAIFAQRCDLAYSGETLDLGTTLTAANLMPQVLYEEDLAAGGVPESVRVLVLSQCEVLTESAARAIRAFRDRGGLVVGDRHLAPGVTADLTAPRVTRNGQAADEQRQVRDGAAKLLADLAPYYEPPVAASTPDIRAYARTYRKTDFLFAVNDRRTAGDYVGQWGRIYEKGLPVEGAVTIRNAAGAVYDCVTHRAVPFTVENGVTRVPVSLAAGDGAVFLVADRPLAPLAARTDGATVRVTTPDVNAMIPIGLFADGAKPRYGVLKAGLYERPYAGAKVRVVNLADGSEIVADRVARLADDRAAASGKAGPIAALRPAVTELPPSQDPGFDHDLATLRTIRCADGKLLLPAKPACDAVELRFGAVKRPLRVFVNGVLAAVFDPADERDANREFRFEAEKLLKWNGANEIKVTDPDGNVLPLACDAVILKII